jgi:hypothetical protein
MQEKYYHDFPGMKIISITSFNASFNIRNRCHDYHYNNVKKNKNVQNFKTFELTTIDEMQILLFFFNNNQVLIP